jgi:hypothetical protein
MLIHDTFSEEDMICDLFIKSCKNKDDSLAIMDVVEPE